MAVARTVTQVMTSVAVNSASYTPTGISFGSATSDRLVVVLVFAQPTGTIGISTIGGITATQAVIESSGGGRQTAIYYANVPTGATGSIAFTDTGSFINSIDYEVVAITGAGTSPTTNTGSFAYGVSTTPNLNLNVVSGGLGLAIVAADRTVSGSWTNATTDSSVADSDAANTGANTGSPLTLTYTGTNAFYTMSGIAFTAAGAAAATSSRRIFPVPILPFSMV